MRFKGWDKQTEDWLELTEHNEWHNKRVGIFRPFFDNHVQLIKCTDLEDMVGRKIYEKDILANKINDKIVVVEYGKYNNIFGDEWYGWYLKGTDANYPMPYDTSNFLVIGNILNDDVLRRWLDEKMAELFK